MTAAPRCARQQKPATPQRIEGLATSARYTLFRTCPIRELEGVHASMMPSACTVDEVSTQPGGPLLGPTLGSGISGGLDHRGHEADSRSNRRRPRQLQAPDAPRGSDAVAHNQHLGDMGRSGFHGDSRPDSPTDHTARAGAAG